MSGTEHQLRASGCLSRVSELFTVEFDAVDYTSVFDVLGLLGDDVIPSHYMVGMTSFQGLKKHWIMSNT